MTAKSGGIQKLLLIIIFILFALVFTLSFGYVRYFKTNSAESFINAKFITPSGVTFGEEEECFVEDSVEFKTYQERGAPNLEIQDIIGYQNNKFGLYVYSTESFIKKADEMVNSNGGDWGYVLIPYNIRDYDEEKWRDIFELLGKKHLIPIIQLWDVNTDDYQEETEKAAKFLAGFPWPIEKKYISMYNEVNDARFWKGRLDPKGYARLVVFTIDTFKKNDKGFFMLNGAFNSSAASSKSYMEEVEYMMKMNEEVPGIFKKLDGWASHPYPQPAFTGKPTDAGRNSIRAYEWELSILRDRFGVEGIPVFITETGWPHAEGRIFNRNFYDAKTVAKYTVEAFESFWLKDERVVAVTPFTIYYDPPFDHFSWVNKDGNPYEQFMAVKKMPKIPGKPPTLFDFEKKIISCN